MNRFLDSIVPKRIEKLKPGPHHGISTTLTNHSESRYSWFHVRFNKLEGTLASFRKVDTLFRGQFQ